MRPTEGQTGPQTVSFVKDAGTSRDVSQGNITSTGAPLDIAINGKGFFTVTTPNGERYTRDGHFSLNGAGQIVTSDGYALQGEGGAITITPTDADIHVAADGTISSVVNGTLNQLGKLRLTDFADERAMTKEGGNLYAGAGAAQPTKATLVQGALESSNVQPVLEISKMIEVMRAYEATATLSKSHEDMTRDAITKLGAMPN